MYPKFTLVLTLAAAMALPTAFGAPAIAQEEHPSPEGFSFLATHPEAAAQPTWGQGIDALAVDGDLLVAGYGDYTDNTGPIHLNPYDLSTGEFVGSQVALAGEEILVFRELGGSLYAPNIDPRTGWNDPTGYVTNVNGAWEEHRHVPFVHVYDMAERVPGEFWMVGSANTLDGTEFGGATAYRSTDAGDTWEFMRQETDEDPKERTGFERYYWIGAAGGKVIMQAHSVTNAPVRIFDGKKWSTVALDKKWTGSKRQTTNGRLCHPWTTDPAQVGHLGDDLTVCNGADGAGRVGSTVTFDGQTLKRHIGTWAGGQVETSPNTYTYANVTDWFEGDDGWLYALSPVRGIARTRDGATFQVLYDTPEGERLPALSLAVHDDRIYLGGREADLHVSDLTVSQMAEANGRVVEPSDVITVRVDKEGKGGGGKDKGKGNK